MGGVVATANEWNHGLLLTSSSKEEGSSAVANLFVNEVPQDGNNVEHFLFGTSSTLNAIRPNHLGVPLIIRYPYIDFRLKDVIGKGRFSTIYKAHSLKDASLVVALKEVRLNDMNRYQIADFRYELNLLSNLRHPNLARIASVFDPTTQKNIIYVISEYLNGGELIPAICRQPQYMEADAIRFAKQLVSAVQYLHSHGVVHGKIIPENLILTQPSFESTLRLVDFGLAQAYTMYHTYYHPNYLHLDEFLVPELPFERRITPAMDIWCVGVIIYIILSGQIPFEGQSPHSLKPLNQEGSFEDPRWTYVSPLAIDFLCKVLIFDPNDRPTADDLGKHPWIDLQSASKISSSSPKPLSSIPTSPPHRQPQQHQRLSYFPKKRIPSNDSLSKSPSSPSSSSDSDSTEGKMFGFKVHRDTFQLEKMERLKEEEEDENEEGTKKSSRAASPCPPPSLLLPSKASSSDQLKDNSDQLMKQNKYFSPNSSPSTSSPPPTMMLPNALTSNQDDEFQDDDDDDFFLHYDLTPILPHIRLFYESRQFLQPVVIFSNTINFAKLGRYMHEKNLAVLGPREKLSDLLQTSPKSKKM